MWASPAGPSGKELTCQCRNHKRGRFPETWECGFPEVGQEDLLEKQMAIHSSIFAWEIPWTEVPGGLQSMGLQKRLTQLSD